MRPKWLCLVATNLCISDALSPPLNPAIQSRALDSNSVQLPTCAALCFASTVSESPCSAADVSCICRNTDSISAAITPCLLASCRTIDVLHTRRYAAVVCGEPVRNDSRRLEVAAWTIFPLAPICVLLRFVSRAPYFGGRLGWDDWTILILLAFLVLPLNIINQYLIKYGLGRDIWMLEEYEIVMVFELYFVSELLYLVSVTVLKISVLLQYLRIFSLRIWIYSLIAISASYGASFIIASLAGCRPFSYNFHRWQAEESGTCIDITREIYASAVINIILDGIITLLPTVQISKLQMTAKRKLLITFIFLAGFLVTGISIARFVVFEQATNANFTYTYIDVTILSTAELNVAIITTSVPAMTPLFRRLAGKRDATTTKRWSGNTPGRASSGATPGASIGTSGLSSGNLDSNSKKKAWRSAQRGRWHGYTDVFSTRGTDTLVSSRAGHSTWEMMTLSCRGGPAAAQEEPRPHTRHDSGHADSLGKVDSQEQKGGF